MKYFRHWWKSLSTDIKWSFLPVLLAIFTASFITLFVANIEDKRMVPAEFPYPIIQSDSTLYARLADNLLQNSTYSEQKEAPFIRSTNWPPGYPLLLAVSFFFFGSAWPLIILQIILFGLSTWFIWQMSRQFVPAKIALIPATIFAFDFSIAYYNGVAMTDGLFMSLITILVYFLFFIPFSKRSYLTYLLLGFLLGWSSLIRTISQYLVLVIPVLYLFNTYWQKQNLRIALAGMGIFLVGAIAVMFPWLQRNQNVLGEPTLATIGPKMLLGYYVTDFLTLQNLTEISEGDFAQSDTKKRVSAQLESEVEALARENNDNPLNHYSEVAIKHILENPVSYTKFHLVGTLPYFLAGSYRHFYVSALNPHRQLTGLPTVTHENIAHRMTEALYSGNIKNIVSAVLSISEVLIEVAWRFILIIGAFTSIFLVKTKEQKILLLIAGTLIAYFAFLTGPSSLTRYRIVTEPILLTATTVGWWYLYLKYHNWHQKHVS